jgi:hypothetical protein
MADGIDFGDPIDFSPQGKTSQTSRGSFDVAAKPVASTPATPKPSIPREPAHMVERVTPLFPRPSLKPLAPVKPVGQPQGALSQPGTPGLQGSMDSAPPEKGSKKMIFLLIGVGVLVILLVSGYLVFTSLNKAQNPTNNQTNQTTQTNNIPTSTSNTTKPTNSVPVVTDPTGDPDGDSLTNQEEAQYGTDANNPDSDGDGYKDGAEVEKGFNPLGTGNLTTPAHL